jgi:hypothetical protein
VPRDGRDAIVSGAVSRPPVPASAGASVDLGSIRLSQVIRGAARIDTAALVEELTLAYLSSH